MHNLEQAIDEWRRKMAAEGINSPAILDELESHLREDIERQLRSGADEERSFAAAAQKIGSAHVLKSEFRKNRFRSVLEKLMIAIAVLVAAFGVFLTSVTMIFCYERLTERLIGFVILGFILVAVFGWSRVVPYLPVISNKRKRRAVELACLAAGFGICTVYIQLFVHQFERPDHVIPIFGFVGLLPIGIGLSLASAIEQAARRNNSVFMRES